MSYRVFIGWDSRFPEPARVLAHSLRKHASKPLDIRFLDLAHLEACYGFRRAHDPLASTQFTYSRFLVPWLCGYQGLALFLDNDMVCRGDVVSLFGEARFSDYMPMLVQHYTTDGKTSTGWPAIKVRKHEHVVADGSTKMYGAVQTAYPRKNWSSMMLMDCSRLTCWTKEVVETAPGSRLHRFEDLGDHEIGDLPSGWNDLEDQIGENTKLAHWTQGGPWYKEYANCPHADLWLAARREWLVSEGRDPETPLPYKAKPRIWREAYTLGIGDRTIDIDDIQMWVPEKSIAPMLAAMTPPPTTAELLALHAILARADNATNWLLDKAREAAV